MKKLIPWLVVGGVALVFAVLVFRNAIVEPNTTQPPVAVEAVPATSSPATSSVIGVEAGSLPMSVEQAISRITENNRYDIPIIATSTTRVWFNRIRESEGCGEYNYIDLATGVISDFRLYNCPTIKVSDSYPFYISDCLYASCYDHKTLYVVNMETLERRAVHTITQEGETTIEGCRDSDYDPLCMTKINFTNGELSIAVYDKMHPIYDTTKPGYQGQDMKALGIYENGNPIRVDIVDLKKEFGIR